MIAEVTIDDKELRAHLAGIVKRKDQITARDKAIVGILSSVVFKDIMEHFDREEGPEGGWPGWSPSYTKFMDSIGRGNNKLLQFTGRLRGSFQPTNVRTSSEGVLGSTMPRLKAAFLMQLLIMKVAENFHNANLCGCLIVR